MDTKEEGIFMKYKKSLRPILEVIDKLLKQSRIEKDPIKREELEKKSSWMIAELKRESRA